MERFNKAELEKYQVTLIDCSYPVTATQVLFNGLDIATAKSIARHYNKVNACYTIWCEWQHEGLDYNEALDALVAHGWTTEGAREYLDGADLESWTVVDLEWACRYVQAR